MGSDLNKVKLNKNFDTILILILLTIFSIGALMLVILSVNVYKNINESLDASFTQTTPLSYIASKIRMCDYKDEIYIGEKEGISALVIKTKENNTVNETWIYAYQGEIYEIYTEEGNPFELDAGIPIISCDKLEFNITQDNILEVTSHMDGYSRTVKVAMHNATKEGQNE